jgi:hypothetical protein
LAALGTSFLWWFVSDRPGRVTRANFDRIRQGTRYVSEEGPPVTADDGMTVGEAEAILGPWVRNFSADQLEARGLYSWAGFEGDVAVAVRNGRVLTAGFYPRARADKVRWLWERLFRQQSPF